LELSEACGADQERGAELNLEDSMSRRIQVRAWIVAVLLSFATLAQAQQPQQNDFPTEDKAVMRGYVLTADKLNAFIDSIGALAAARKGDDSLAREVDAADSEPAGTLADLRAQVSGHPKVYEFFQRHGLTVDDTVLIPLVAGYASAGTEGNDPVFFSDRVSPAQVNFMRDNSALKDRLVRAYAALYMAN
jgi:hypothetical protein